MLWNITMSLISLSQTVMFVMIHFWKCVCLNTCSKAVIVQPHLRKRLSVLISFSECLCSRNRFMQRTVKRLPDTFSCRWFTVSFLCVRADQFCSRPVVWVPPPPCFPEVLTICFVATSFSTLMLISPQVTLYAPDWMRFRLKSSLVKSVHVQRTWSSNIYSFLVFWEKTAEFLSSLRM